MRHDGTGESTRSSAVFRDLPAFYGTPKMNDLVRKVVLDLRRGRALKLLAAATAFGAPPRAFKIYLEQYKASFGACGRRSC
jgi:hypothetical protein